MADYLTCKLLGRPGYPAWAVILVVHPPAPPASLGIYKEVRYWVEGTTQVTTVVLTGNSHDVEFQNVRGDWVVKFELWAGNSYDTLELMGEACARLDGPVAPWKVVFGWTSLLLLIITTFGLLGSIWDTGKFGVSLLTEGPSVSAEKKLGPQQYGPNFFEPAPPADTTEIEQKEQKAKVYSEDVFFSLLYSFVFWLITLVLLLVSVGLFLADKTGDFIERRQNRQETTAFTSTAASVAAAGADLATHVGGEMFARLITNVLTRIPGVGKMMAKLFT